VGKNERMPQFESYGEQSKTWVVCGVILMFSAADWQWNQQHEQRLTAFPRGWRSDGWRGKLGGEFARRHFDLLVSEGRPILFLAGLCGTAGTLLVPVGYSLTLTFYAAGLGAVILFCLIFECPASHSTTDTAHKFFKGSYVIPKLGQIPTIRSRAKQSIGCE